MPTSEQIRDDEAQSRVFLMAMYDLDRAGDRMPTLNRVCEISGVPNDDATLTRLTLQLRDRGHISGQAAMGGPVGRPKITEDGKAAVVGWIAAPQQPATANISGFSVGSNSNVNIAQNSPGATQSNTVEPYEADDVGDWFDRVENAAAELVQNHRRLTYLQDYIARGRSEVAEPKPHRGRLRELVGHALELLGPTANASLATAGIIESGRKIFEQLGQ
jgi:hypothetical protein